MYVGTPEKLLEKLEVQEENLPSIRRRSARRMMMLRKLRAIRRF